MTDSKKYYWLRLKEGFFDDKIIKKLRKLAGGDTFVIIYLKMQLLSIKTEGKLFFEGIENSFVEELALDIDEEIENVKITVSYLEKLNLIESTITDEYLLPGVLGLIGSESESAERVRRYREKQDEKMLQCNADVTDCNAVVTKCNTEIEKEIEIDIYKKNSREYQKKYSDESFEMKCILYLINSIKAEMPDAKLPSTAQQIDKWCDHIEKMVRIDKRSDSDIYNTLVFARTDAFWKSNIRSTSKFREKYETLYSQSKNKGKLHQPQPNRFNQFPQRTYTAQDYANLERKLINK